MTTKEEAITATNRLYGYVLATKGDKKKRGAWLETMKILDYIDPSPEED